MSVLINPTPCQKKAIEAGRNVVITACPGSGKTAVIVERMRNEVATLSDYQGVIGITFTVKASKELQARCKNNGIPSKSSFIGIIDHFCLSEIVFPFLNKLFGRATSKVECKFYKELDDIYKERLPNLSDPKVVFSTADYEQYESEFQRHYNDGFVLLEAVGVIANAILQRSQACRRYLTARYISIYIDEYQDSSEPQHTLFLLLLGLGLKATAVGDINQSIYEWRGSNSSYLLDLIKDSGTFQHCEIDVNHRCPPSITNYANRLLNPNAVLLPSDTIRVFHRKFNGVQSDLARQLNDYIPATAEAFGVDLSDIAILVRRNSGITTLSENLTIPFRVYTDDPLSRLNTVVTKLYRAFLGYRFNSSMLVSDISEFEKQSHVLDLASRTEIIDSIKALREVAVEEFESAVYQTCIKLLGIEGSSSDKQALLSVLSTEIYLDQYRPLGNEVQVMTLHKAKGLEFEIVFHMDLYEWVFPYREYTGNFDEYVFPEWEQELNLHYVGITRAKKACILAYSDRRLNSDGANRQGSPSQFLNLPGLSGLYA
jgi:DNA helicase II / ATP-dependent DNA helicase PcrA